MRIRFSNTFAILACTFFIISCNQSEKENSQTVSENTPVVSADTLETNNRQNNFYRVLAGLDTAGTTVDSVLYNEYNGQWVQMKSKLLDSIQRWKAGILPAECQQTKTLFYPFSGPDFIIPNTLFPEVEKIVMFGLEIPGIDISSQGNAYAASLVPKMRMSLRDYFGKSYFITKNMIQDLHKDSLNGVTPLIASFIVRSGYNIVSIRNFILDSTGQKSYTEERELINTKSSQVKGVEFIYTADKKTKRIIDYLAFNAEDANLDNHKEIEIFLDKNIPGQNTTYLKSASYLLHYSAFSRIRNLCIKKTKYLLQDDTGIPYKYLANEWNCRIFGSYIKPIADFSGVYQKDLDSLYRVNNINEKLPFSMGYHYFTGKQNLMFAQRK